MKLKLNSYLLFFILVIVLIAIWWIVAEASGFYFLPTPLKVFQAFPVIISNGELGRAILETAQPLLIGFFISLGAGVAVGIIMGGFPTLGLAAEPLITSFYSFPHGILIPAIVLFFGIGLWARVTIVIIYTIFVVILNTYAGVINTAHEFHELGSSFRLSRLQVWRRIILPGASAFILTGVRISTGNAIRGAVMSELLIGAMGLGGMVMFYSGFWRLDIVFAVVLVLMAIGVASNYLLRYVEKKLTPWKKQLGSS